MDAPRLTPADHEAFARDGVLIVPGLVGAELVERVRGEGDVLAPTAQGSGRKTENAWRRHAGVRELAAHPGVMAVLAELYGRRAIPFQTLNFQRGSEQRPHADSIHFDTVPAGLVCGVWVALEDVGPDQGPLVYRPGSHLGAAIGRSDALDAGGAFDYGRYEDLVGAGDADRPDREFHAAAGDVLVWAADVVHGGAVVRDPASTRRSQVTHYFFEGAAYYTPMRSDPDAGLLALREPLVDIATGRRVPPALDGHPARIVRVGDGRSRLLGRDDPPPPPAVRLRSVLLGAGVEARHLVASVAATVRGRPSRRTTRRGSGSVR